MAKMKSAMSNISTLKDEYPIACLPLAKGKSTVFKGPKMTKKIIALSLSNSLGAVTHCQGLMHCASNEMLNVP